MIESGSNMTQSEILKKALFLDRDGVINKMAKYDGEYDTPRNSSDVRLVDGILEIIKWANSNNILTVVISNQPGIAKGKISQKQFAEVEDEIDRILILNGAKIDSKYYCFHHPRGIINKFKKECACRKPKPGLIFQVAHKMNIDLENSFFVGDKGTDAVAGSCAGCKTIIYLHKEDSPDKVFESQNTPSTYKVHDMIEVLNILKDNY